MSQVAGFDPPPPRALAIERFALGALLLAAIALSLIKVGATDTPWHLATARHAWAAGGLPAFPATNTFSYTHPDHPLYQQYPIYDTVIWGVFKLGGWEGLSLFSCFGWLAVFALWVRWGRGWGWVLPLNLAWLIALLGLRRRFILCPDILTQVYLVCALILIDVYRRDGPRALFALVALVPLQWAMANTHQLFPLGLALQGCFLLHLLVVKRFGGRYGIAPADRDLGLAPVVGVLFASIVVCLFTPIGTRIIDLPTWESVTTHRLDVVEFDYIWNRTAGRTAAICALIIGASGFAVARERWHPFEALALLVGAATCVIAVRGLPLFAALAAATFARNLARIRDRGVVVGVHALAIRHDPNALRPTLLARNLRTSASALTLLVCVSLITVQWFGTARALRGEEPGIGRHPTCWPSDALALIRQDPPPGRMLNLGWYSGNQLIFALPDRKVFVDPRFEAYPRAFLKETIRATRDPVALGGLMVQWRPDWLILETTDPEQRERAVELIRSRSAPWALVYLGPLWIILVRAHPSPVADAPAMAIYLDRHAELPTELECKGWVDGRPDLLGLQQIVVARFFDELGLARRADELLEKATVHAHAHDHIKLELSACRVWRAGSSLAAGRLTRAVEEATAALDLIPGSADALLIRGKAQYYKGNNDAALKDLAAAARVSADAPGLQHARGEALLKAERFGEAVAAFDKALAVLPATEKKQIAATRYVRGRAYAGMKRHADALREFDAALVEMPNEWQVVFARADALEQLGRLDEALSGYEQAYILAPGAKAKVEISGRRATLQKRIREKQ